MVEKYKTLFGKYILDSLTRSLYENSKAIYREFVQNAADAIDQAVERGILHERSEGIVTITIDETRKKITIEDNGIGILSDEVLSTLMNIGDSDKDKEKDKGFRGIGRLAALGYCDTLTIETSFQGESVKNIIIWNAKELMNSLDTKDREGAAELFQRVAEWKKIENEKIDTHYFRIVMENVNDEELLDKHEVKKYLSMIAPVPYDRAFLFRNHIYEYLRSHNFSIDEYTVNLNDESVVKPYTTIIYQGDNVNKTRLDDVTDIEFFQFHTPKEEVLLWGWYGIWSFKKQIPPKCNLARGIRLRKGNIQIGNSHCLVKLHKEPRGNFYFVGEIHVLHPALYPNTQRSYFFNNKITQVFENVLRDFFYTELYSLYDFSSRVRNAQKRIDKFTKFRQEYEEKSQNIGFKHKDEIQHYVKKFDELKVDAEKAKTTLSNIDTKLPKDPIPKRRIFDKITRQNNSEILDITTPSQPEKKNIKYVFDDLSLLSKSDRKLIARVFAVVDKCLPNKELVENIRLKIIEEFKHSNGKNQKNSSS